MRRRDFLAAANCLPLIADNAATPTRFQLACMTLPYAAHPLERALSGIQSAGYNYVAWGTSHRDAAGLSKPVLSVEAPLREAAALAGRCRDMGLAPVMMFSTVNVEAERSVDLHKHRIDQAAAAGVPFLLTFGKTKPGEYEVFVQNLKSIAPHARSSKVALLIKQHGGNTGTGKDCARIVRDVADEGLKVCYDGGNVLDYERQDPIADIGQCWRDVRAFCIKDHRVTPRNEDCGPGFGEIDHYKLLAPVMNTGLTMPLAFENIFEPLSPRPTSPAAIDELAGRARIYIETVLRGLAAQASSKV